MTGYRTCADCPAPVKFRDRFAATSVIAGWPVQR